jgi:hypothetical protein
MSHCNKLSSSEADLIAALDKNSKSVVSDTKDEEQSEARPRRTKIAPQYLDDYVLDNRPSTSIPKVEISLEKDTKVTKVKSERVSETNQKPVIKTEGIKVEAMAEHEAMQPINVAVKTTEDVPKFKGNKLPSDEGFFIPGPSIHQWIAALEASMILQKINDVREQIVMMYSHVHQGMGDARICLQKFLNPEEYGNCTCYEVKSQLYTAYTPVGQSGL